MANIGDIRHFERRTIAQHQGEFGWERIFRGALKKEPYLIATKTVESSSGEIRVPVSSE